MQHAGMGSLDFDSLQPEASAANDNVPGVRPVDQKGHGLSSLKESLSLFSQDSNIAYPAESELSTEAKREMYEQGRQRQLESDTLRTALERWHKEFEDRQKAGIDIASSSARLGPMMNQWHTDLVARIKEELKLVDEAQHKPSQSAADKERDNYGVFLRCLEPDKLAALAILTVMSIFSKLGMDKGMKLAVLAASIGKELQDELMATAALNKDTGADVRRHNILKKILAGRKEKEGRLRWQTLVRKLQKEDPTVTWPPTVAAKIGAVLMSFLFEVGKAPVKTEDPKTKREVITMHPAFQHSYQISWGRRVGLIHMHSAIVGILAKEPPAHLLGRHLPMVCKPRPWEGSDDGAYLLYKTNIVRTTPGENLQPAYIEAALESHGLEQVREGLNILGTTGWCINREVFDVMLEAWNSGEGVGNLAPLEPNLPLPPRPSPEEGPRAAREWHRRTREIENQRTGYHSVRCFQNFQMEIARAYRNEEFYLPHNLDFRGRAYPLPPYLNQMGADNVRSLLLFSEAKPLGESGLRWLKVQIANLAGFDKASISEREQFAMDHLDDILDSANKGLHGKRWWLEAEDPWQCLAACCELRNALRESDPTQYLSRLPIHQDGSCNGLQHYAALGGDAIGAQQVNLEPSDRPSDVYTGVAEFVKEKVAHEAAQGDPIAQGLEGKITRKIVKQTVMTNVYGVTFIGAMRQVRKQLIDHYPSLSDHLKMQGSTYIARKIFEALSTMFTGAHDIQYWLGACANRITQSLSGDQIEAFAKEAMTGKQPNRLRQRAGSDEGLKSKAGSGINKTLAEQFTTTVIWTSPLGLPVVQPYRTRKARRVDTSLQSLSIVDGSISSVVSHRKQLQAFPPNFIHSLDATHMLLSAIACRKAGLSFSAVHDSFWTHASDVDSMNQILREAFVRMHSDDVIKRLAEEFKVRYGNNLFLARVEKSSKIAQAIGKRRQHVQGNKGQELLDEYKRQKLLKSEDPELQAQAREMVTPASIFEQMGGTDDDLTALNSLGETRVGHVPENLANAERRPDAMGMDLDDPAIANALPDLAMTETAPRPDSEAAGSEADDMEEKGPKKSGAKKKSQPKRYITFWLPVTIPDVPAKGTWDVTRIRQSQYFFS